MMAVEGDIAGGITASSPSCCEDLPDFAPASFFLSKDAELDWLDRNAFMERKDSGKGASLPPPPPCSSHTQIQYKYCLSVKSKPSFMGLPSYADPKPRRPPTLRLFPKRPSKSSSGRKSDALLTDPSSPKVSCIGRVRSRKDRKKKKKKQQQPDQDQDEDQDHPMASIRSGHSRTGFWTNFLSIFGSRGPHSRPEVDGEPAAAAAKLKKSRSSSRSRKRRLGKSKSLRKRSISESSSSTPADPPSLGVAGKQFTSGRRSDAWAADLDAHPVVVGATKLE